VIEAKLLLEEVVGVHVRKLKRRRENERPGRKKGKAVFYVTGNIENGGSGEGQRAR
jgi:hypothetical protein